MKFSIQSIFVLICFLSFSLHTSAASRTLDISPFTGFNVANSFNVVLKQGSKQSVKVEGEEKDINNITTTVKNGVWRIDTEEDGKYKKNYSNQQKTTVYITLPKLDYIGVSGTGNVSCDDFDVSTIKLAIAGSGKIKINLNASSDINTAISGSGNILVSGKGGEMTARIAGSGNVSGKSLEVKSLDAKISGSGNIYADVASSINASIAGSGSVVYTGTPKVTSKVTGSGKVKPSSK